MANHCCTVPGEPSTVQVPPAKSLHQEVLDLADSLNRVRHDFHDLIGEPTALTELGLDSEASLTQTILHCKWLSGEIVGQLDLVRQETGRIG